MTQQLPSRPNNEFILQSAPDRQGHEKASSLWKKIRQKIEVTLCRLGFWIFPKIPYSILVLASRVLGTGAYFFAVSERRVALANLKAVFGTTYSSRERAAIAKKSFQSFARTAAESFRGHRLLEDGLDKRFEFAPGSLDLLNRLVSQKRGLIALTFHYGNWEWLSLAWGMAGYSTKVVAQPIKNPGVEELFRFNRERAGHRLIHRRNAARQLYKALKRGEIIGLLVDLNSSVEEGGAFFDFFGLPALSTRIAGLLALRTHAPIVISIAYPQKDCRYRIEIGPEIPYNPEAPSEQEIAAITQRWLSYCEEVIRRHPEFWMWMYKRWKVRPTPEIGRYPFYSFYDPHVIHKLK